MFSETVKVDGQNVPRFQPLGASSKTVGESIERIISHGHAAARVGDGAKRSCKVAVRLSLRRVS